TVLRFSSSSSIALSPAYVTTISLFTLYHAPFGGQNRSSPIQCALLYMFYNFLSSPKISFVDFARFFDKSAGRPNGRPARKTLFLVRFRIHEFLGFLDDFRLEVRGQRLI